MIKPDRIHLYRMERRRWLANMRWLRQQIREEGGGWLHGDWYYFDLIRSRGPEIRARYS